MRIKRKYKEKHKFLLCDASKLASNIKMPVIKTTNQYAFNKRFIYVEEELF